MSKKTRKLGPLSLEDQKFIIENAAIMSLDEMADALNRNTDPIKKFIKTQELISVDGIETDVNLRDRIRARKILEKKYYWGIIKSQLITDEECDEVDIFRNRWIDLFLQFKEDITSSEESQMQEVIMLAIQMDRIRRSEVKNIKKITELEKRITDEYQYAPDSRDPMLPQWEVELQMCKAMTSSFGNQIKQINADIQKYNKDLKVTRDQRYNKVDSGDKTFASLIRRLQDEKQRTQISREAELIRIATEKKRIELEGFHQYGSGEIDIPILNKNSAKKLSEENEK